MASSFFNASACAALCAFAILAGGCGQHEPETKGSQLETRRLTEAQYRQSIADIFGADIQVAGRFQPEARVDGLLAVGSTEVTVAGSGFEQYYAMASHIADQVTNAEHRDRLLSCKPHSASEPDDGCATRVFGQYGALILRHPLDPARLNRFVTVAGKVATERHDFYSGVAFGLTGLLSEPDFLFRVERTERDPDGKGNVRLDGYSKAARLSFFLWNTTPDAALLAAAQRGELDTPRGLKTQVDRLLASPRTEAGVRAFFTDFLAFDTFDSLEKDGVLYPAFNQKTGSDAEEQTLRTVVDLLVTHKGDYRDLFTTRRTFMTRALGRVYDVPVVPRTGWAPYEFAQDDPRAGILTQLSFTALHAHPGRSSPTLRGKALRELLLCQKVPTPPANVNFAIVQDTKNAEFRTARARLTAHRSEATCAGCHKIMDPMGLALESFDGEGHLRSTENDVPIDTTGELDGVSFKDAAGLGRAMHDNPAATNCLVTSLYGYAAGHKPVANEAAWMTWLRDGFASSGYRLPDLMRSIATSDAFYRVTADPAAQSGKSASTVTNFVKEASK